MERLSAIEMFSGHLKVPVDLDTRMSDHMLLQMWITRTSKTMFSPNYHCHIFIRIRMVFLNKIKPHAAIRWLVQNDSILKN